MGNDAQTDRKKNMQNKSRLERATRLQPPPEPDTLREWRIDGTKIIGPEFEHHDAPQIEATTGFKPTPAYIVATVDNAHSANFCHYPKHIADIHRKLIVAAPELLRALESMIQASNELAVALTDEQCRSALINVALLATDASFIVAKAKGQS